MESSPKPPIKSPETVLTLSTTPEGNAGVEMRFPSAESLLAVRRLFANNRSDDPDIKLRQSVGAFLQCDADDYVLIEMWKGEPKDHEAFIARLNELVRGGGR